MTLALYTPLLAILWDFTYCYYDSSDSSESNSHYQHNRESDETVQCSCNCRTCDGPSGCCEVLCRECSNHQPNMVIVPYAYPIVMPTLPTSEQNSTTVTNKTADIEEKLTTTSNSPKTDRSDTSYSSTWVPYSSVDYKSAEGTTPIDPAYDVGDDTFRKNLNGKYFPGNIIENGKINKKMTFEIDKDNLSKTMLFVKRDNTKNQSKYPKYKIHHIPEIVGQKIMSAVSSMDDVKVRNILPISQLSQDNEDINFDTILK